MSTHVLGLSYLLLRLHCVASQESQSSYCTSDPTCTTHSRGRVLGTPEPFPCVAARRHPWTVNQLIPTSSTPICQCSVRQLIVAELTQPGIVWR